MRDYANLYSCLSSDLGLDGSSKDSHLYSDMSPGTAARVALASSFFKKLCPKGNSNSADMAALIKFKAINEALPELDWDFEAQNEVESCFYDYFRDNLRTAIEPNSPEDCFSFSHLAEHMGVGPGAAQLADSSYMVSKLFESTMSYTNSDLIPLYRAALVETGFWCEAERQRNIKFGFTKVEGGKIFFAAKNADISRTCCTEANLNMLFQKAIGAFLEARLIKCYRINLSTQPDLNRELTRRGSIDGSFGTIDLTSASDSIGYAMLKKSAPEGKLMAYIRMSRSEHVVLPDGTKLRARMVSTMGNGFTFPLQTLIFACVVEACYQLMDIPLVVDRLNNFGVFGDDIVVRSDAYEFVCRMLKKLGFQVNVGKSFNSGPFRESCGHDYFAGVNIRGVYIKSLEAPQQVYSAINRLLRWSALHGIELPQTIRLLRSWARDIRVPPCEADDAGIHVPFVLTRPKLDSSYWFKYRAYVKKKRQMTISEPDDLENPVINDYGIACGYLSGYIRRRDHSYTSLNVGSTVWEDGWAASVAIRERKGARPRYKVVDKTIPYWDYFRFLSPGDDHPGWDDRRTDLAVGSQEAWKSLLVATFSK